MKFLIDECRSLDLVTLARESGHEAYHVAHVGKAGWRDWNVAQHAREGDFILVTSNASHFRHIYAARPLHAGLAILTASLGRLAQKQLFRGTLAELVEGGEPINQVVEASFDGEDVVCVRYNFPPSAA